jgi:hypothetical protein
MTKSELERSILEEKMISCWEDSHNTLRAAEEAEHEMLDSIKKRWSQGEEYRGGEDYKKDLSSYNLLLFASREAKDTERLAYNDYANLFEED